MRKETLTNAVKELFPDANIRESVVNKDGNDLIAISIMKNEESTIGPTLYPERYEDPTEEEMTYFYSWLKNIVTKAWEEGEKIASYFANPSPEHIRRVLRKNCDPSVPHKDFLDVKIIYKIVNPELQGYSATITKEIMEHMKLNPEELYSISARNMKNTHILKDINEMFGVEDMPPMLVLSNQELLNGASFITDNDLMNTIYGMYGKFYIIPSSVNEVLIIPSVSAEDIKGIKELISIVNNTEVPKEDVLSDNLYYFDGTEVKVA